MAKIYKNFVGFYYLLSLSLLLGNGIVFGQGANAFESPGENAAKNQEGLNGQQSQGQSNTPTKNSKKSDTEEDNFSIDDAGDESSSESSGDIPLSPTQNETGDEFFTNDGSKSTEDGKEGTVAPNAAAIPQNPVPPSNTAPPPVNAAPTNPVPTFTPVANTNPGPPLKTALQVMIPDQSSKPLTVTNDFAGSPAVPGTMRQMADGEAPETYVVQRGDTLFDICDQLIDEKSYWPKLWSMNPYIRNPHFIFPAMKLRFYPGDQDTPPYLQVVSEDDVVPIDKGDLDEKQLVADTAPPADLKSGIPPETKTNPEIEVIGPDQLADELSDLFMSGGKRYNSAEITIEVPGFIFAEPREPKAYVLGGRYGELSLGQGQRATLEATEEGALGNGSLHTVIRPGPEIYDPVSGDFVGYLYYFVGNILVVGKIEEDIYSSIVQSTRLTVRPDDLVVEYISTSRTVPSSTVGVPKSDIDASIVAYEYDNQLLGAEGQSLFIDKGSQDGVSPGMYFSIYQTPRLLSGDFSEDNLTDDFHQVGLMRIIDVTTQGAVGYVLESSREIKIDDRTRNPNR